MSPFVSFVSTLITHLKPASGFRFRNKLGGIALGLLATVVSAGAEIHQLNNDEMVLFQKVASSSAQQRKSVKLDPILCIVARQRAKDMMRRNYFSHVSPSGKGPNYQIRRAGYVLPSYYDTSLSGNNVESIGMTTGNSKEMFSNWLKSSGHRPHLLGEFDFYRNQTSVGVGVVRAPEDPHYRYYVFLSAPPNAAVSPRVVTLKSSKGVTLATTRPVASVLAPFTGSE